jgi:pimeloyl-ACP methyl ester carboxylesterase
MRLGVSTCPILPISLIMAAFTPLKFISVAPRSTHTASIIFAHGLGDSGHGWQPVANVCTVRLVAKSD